MLGEISAADFITGDALATSIGLTAGVSLHSTAGWLKFKDPVDNRIKYVAKRPLRRSISWNQINAVGAAQGEQTVVIKGNTYKVRLLKGLSTSTYTGSDAFDPVETHGSEWNRLMYHISGKPFKNVNNVLTSEGIDEGDWAKYSEGDLLMNYPDAYGAASWVYERGIYRGLSGVSRVGRASEGSETAQFGWRPVLELIE